MRHGSLCFMNGLRSDSAETSAEFMPPSIVGQGEGAADDLDAFR